MEEHQPDLRVFSTASPQAATVAVSKLSDRYKHDLFDALKN
jgi:hypothetical protein